MKEKILEYIKITEYLEDLIRKGEGRKSPLPTELELTQLFHVSRMTVRHAFQQLVNAGLVVRYPGRGTFARGPHVVETLHGRKKERITEQWSFQGHDVQVKVLNYQLCKAPEPIAKKFGVKIGDPLTYLERVRLADHIPISLDYRYLIPEVYEKVKLDEINQYSLLDILPRHNFRIREGTFHISIGTAQSKESDILEVLIDTPMLVRGVEFFDEMSNLVIYGHSNYPAERVTYEVRVDITANERDDTK